MLRTKLSKKFALCVIVPIGLLLYLSKYYFGTNLTVRSEYQMRTYLLQEKSYPNASKFDKPAEHSSTIICATGIGGLGNHMFQFAAAFGIAASKNMSLKIHKSNLVVNAFNINKTYIYDGNKYCNNVRRRVTNLNCQYDPNFVNFDSKSSFHLGVYMQSWVYFNHSMDALREQFIFIDEIKNRANSIVESVIKKHQVTSRDQNTPAQHKVTLVGVHIRRGDMTKSPHKEFGYNLATASYLNNAVNHFTSQNFSNLLFVVCTNDLEWSKQNMPKNESVEYIIGNTANVDLAVLATCDHTIMTIGTFGWWAAFLANGQATFYKWPGREGSPFRRTFSKTHWDFFLPHWKGF